jgi:hypothetical protein
LAVSVANVRREVELWRHTDADGDALTAEGVRAALVIGASLSGKYDLAVSTGAQRATQTLACFLAALAQEVPGGVVVESRLRSDVEDPTNEAAVLGLTGELVPPLAKGEGVLVVADDDGYSVTPLR